MAITTNSFTIQSLPSAGKDFHLSMYSADASDEEVVVAAVSGSSHFLTKLMFRSATACTVSIGSGSDGTMTTLHLGPIPLDAASGFFSISFGGKGMRCDSGLALVLITSATAPIMIYAEGKTCNDSLK